MSIKNFKNVGVFLALLLIVAAMPASAQMKVGYVDTQYILANYSVSVDVAKKLDGERAAMAAELQKMEDDIVAANNRLQQQGLMLSEEKKREQMAKLQQDYANLQQQAQVKDQELAKRREELLGPVFEKIDTAIKAVGDEQGFDFVMKAEALLFAKDALNLTETVLEKLNTEAAAK